MTESTHDCTDLDQLLRLIGLLGDPHDPGFWDSWRTESGGYAFKKMKGGIEALARADKSSHAHEAYDFADYVLLLFSTDSDKEEQQLVTNVGSHLTSGSVAEVGTQYLADLRATAWRVWRDHKRITPDRVIRQWQRVPHASDHRKWRALREE